MRDSTYPTGRKADPTTGQMECCVCGCRWTPILRPSGRMPRGYRKCPNGCLRASAGRAVRELAEDVAGRIVTWEPDRRLDWGRDRLRVRVDLDGLFPLDGGDDESAVRRRRNSFLGALAATLSKTHWKKYRTGCTFYWSGRR